MPEFQVRIKEMLEKTVDVKAESMAQAKEIAEKRYRDSEYILDASDFKGVAFETLYPYNRGYER